MTGEMYEIGLLRWVNAHLPESMFLGSLDSPTAYRAIGELWDQLVTLYDRWVLYGRGQRDDVTDAITVAVQIMDTDSPDTPAAIAAIRLATTTIERARDEQQAARHD